ncbi:MAG: hypothetical protein UY32_C0015G0001, partial [Candidatus Jorgensenbacteria bacterium GW2011_GWC1_48_8]
KRINNFQTLIHLPKIIAAAALMSVFILATSGLGINVIVIIAAAALVYFAALWLFKEPIIRDLNPLALINGVKEG